MVWLTLNAFGSKYVSHWPDYYCVHEVVLWTVFRLFMLLSFFAVPLCFLLIFSL